MVDTSRYLHATRYSTLHYMLSSSEARSSNASASLPPAAANAAPTASNAPSSSDDVEPPSDDEPFNSESRVMKASSTPLSPPPPAAGAGAGCADAGDAASCAYGKTIAFRFKILPCVSPEPVLASERFS